MARYKDEGYHGLPERYPDDSVDSVEDPISERAGFFGRLYDDAKKAYGPKGSKSFRESFHRTIYPESPNSLDFVRPLGRPNPAGKYSAMDISYMEKHLKDEIVTITDKNDNEYSDAINSYINQGDYDIGDAAKDMFPTIAKFVDEIRTFLTEIMQIQMTFFENIALAGAVQTGEKLTEGYSKYGVQVPAEDLAKYTLNIQRASINNLIATTRGVANSARDKLGIGLTWEEYISRLAAGVYNDMLKTNKGITTDASEDGTQFGSIESLLRQSTESRK